jgi:hypothetical protein
MKLEIFADLPPLSGTASREIVRDWSKPGEATNATRKEGFSTVDHLHASRDGGGERLSTPNSRLTINRTGSLSKATAAVVVRSPRTSLGMPPRMYA